MLHHVAKFIVILILLSIVLLSCSSTKLSVISYGDARNELYRLQYNDKIISNAIFHQKPYEAFRMDYIRIGSNRNNDNNNKKTY